MKALLHPEVEVPGTIIEQRCKGFEEVARATGIKLRRFYRIMSGEADMTMKEEELICDYLKIEVAWVILRDIRLREDAWNERTTA